MHRRRLLAAPFLMTPFAARAQSLFGDRPIRMIVPVAAAGASDIVARILADAMTPLLGRRSSWRTSRAPAARLAPTPSSNRRRMGRRSMSPPTTTRS
jgi:hypothetical protein